MISDALEFLALVFLLLGVPVFSVNTMRRPELFQIPRRALYSSAVLSTWLLAVIIGAVELVVQRRVWGFKLLSWEVFARWAGLITGIAFAAVVAEIVLEKFGLWPEESALVRLLMPETAVEKLWCVFLLAPTAGICEEFVYRGFLLPTLSVVFHSMAWAVIISSAAFGLAHPYQGWRGMARAALLGALLAWPVVRLGSLYPSMAAHFLIDAVSLGWLGPATLRRESQS